MVARQAMKENLQCTSKYGHLRISQDICHVRMTDIEGFLTIYGHGDNLLNNNKLFSVKVRRLFESSAYSSLVCWLYTYKQTSRPGLTRCLYGLSISALSTNLRN